MFCRVQARTPINCPVSYLLGEPAEISEISLITNSFELEREAREPRARSASSVVEARAKREKRAARSARSASCARSARSAVGPSAKREVIASRCRRTGSVTPVRRLCLIKLFVRGRERRKNLSKIRTSSYSWS